MAAKALRMQFDDLDQQNQANTLGMWIFLGTEVLFFGGLFAVYGVYRWLYPDAFVAGSEALNLTLGSINTMVLLVSSFAIAAADHCVRKNRRRAFWLLAATLALGLLFLGIKAAEYWLEVQHSLVPVMDLPFHWEGAQPEQVKLFFGLYFTMTGLHALHLFIGCGLVAVMMVLCQRSNSPPRLQFQVRLTALYWHFVDVVWVFLFPLLYLAR